MGGVLVCGRGWFFHLFLFCVAFGGGLLIVVVVVAGVVVVVWLGGAEWDCDCVSIDGELSLSVDFAPFYPCLPL
jgi:hypothetical protein